MGRKEVEVQIALVLKIVLQFVVLFLNSKLQYKYAMGTIIVVEGDDCYR